MGFRAGLALLLIASGCELAFADAESDCRRSWDTVVSIRACTEVIDRSAYSPEQRAEAFGRRGNARAAAGADEDAIRDFDSAIKLRPDDAAAYAARGQVRLSRGDNHGAIADLAVAIRLEPRSSEFLVVRGHANMVDGHPDEAIADFSAALVLDPKSAGALNNRGLAYRKKGDFDRAIADYNAAITINPLYALAFNNRGYVCEAKGQKPQAIADFRQALLFDPTLSGAKDGLRRIGVAGNLTAESEAFAQNGKKLAEKNCSWCHAIGSSGESPNAKAPQFRTIQSRHPLVTLREPLSRGVAAPHDQMPRFQLTNREIDEIVAYINSLKVSN
jgi:tetratricopeptide (TPR) repeat protein